MVNDNEATDPTLSRCRLLVEVAPKQLGTKEGSAPQENGCGVGDSFPFWNSKSVRDYQVCVRGVTDTDDVVLFEWQTSWRFSDFYRRFTKKEVVRAIPWSMRFLPPKGNWLSNYVTDEGNVADRAQQMRDFLYSVLNHNGGQILHLLLCDTFDNTNERFRNGLYKLGQIRIQQKQAEQRARVAATEARVQAQKAARQAQEKGREKAAAAREACRTKVQYLNVTKLETRAVHCPVPCQFELHTHPFSMAGDAKIYGANGVAWFRLRRTDFPRLSPWADLTYQIVTMQGGVPLLEMKERFRMFDHLCQLFYVTATGKRELALTVHREFQFAMFSEEFKITGKSHLGTERFHYTGQWLSGRLSIGNRTAARVSRHVLSLTNGYTVDVAPQQDILLTLGICCAISRIHADISQNNNSITV